MTGPHRVALIPLDERPVNTGLPADVAATMGAQLVMPPRSILPRFRSAGDVDGLGRWLFSEAARPDTDALVVCIDTLVHGGLIPARVSDERAMDVLPRLEVLQRIRALRPDLPIYAISLVTRATDSYSNVEEPDYWSDYGRDVHRFGGDVHRLWSTAGTVPERMTVPGSSLPDWVRRDFAVRRLRNHLVTLAALDLQWAGVITDLAITADDTAEFSAGSAEQRLLDYWRIVHPSSHVDVYPGADETGSTMVSKALVTGTGQHIFVRLVADSEEGMLLVPPYENAPVQQSVVSQLHASGAEVAAGGDLGDLTLVIHTPDPGRGDLFGAPALRGDSAAVTPTVRAVRDAIDRGMDVAVADLRFGNGADAALIEALAQSGLLWKLCAYGGWNTAGNALGSTVALGVSYVLGKRLGTLDVEAARRALARRIVDDYAWQSIQRSALSESLFDGQIAPVSDDRARAGESVALAALRATLASLEPATNIELRSVTFPWHRSFEVDLTFAGDHDSLA